jgi:hypothetical protein
MVFPERMDRPGVSPTKPASRMKGRIPLSYSRKTIETCLWQVRTRVCSCKKLLTERRRATGSN